MLQKLLSFCVCLSIIFSQSFVTFAQDSEYEYSREEVLSVENGSEYIERIESIVPELTYSELQSVKSQLSTLMMSGDIDYNSDIGKILQFLSIVVIEENSLRQGGTPLSTDEVQESTEILKNLQGLLGNELRSTLEIANEEWMKVSEYSENGSISFNLQAETPQDISLKGGFDISEYNYTQNGFDSRFEGDISGFMESYILGDELTFRGETFLDLISKDGQMYALLKDINISQNSLEENIDILVEKLEELASSNTYLTLEDEFSKEALMAFSNIGLSDLEAYITRLETTPLLEAYAKTDTAYLLRPTKDFCNEVKELMSVFDPFSGKSCSDAQYDDLLEEFYQSGFQILLTPGVINTLNISLSDTTTSMNMDLFWNQDELKNISFNVHTPDNAENEYMNFEWLFGESIIMDMKITDMMSGNMEVLFYTDGSIQSFEMLMTSDEYMNLEAVYRNNYFDMTLYYKDIWESYECSINGLLKESRGNLTGTCSITGTSISYLGTDSDTLSISGDMEYSTIGDNENVYLTIDMESGENFSINMDLKANNTRIYKETNEILAPKNTKDIDEFSQELFEAYYSNDELDSDETFFY